LIEKSARPAAVQMSRSQSAGLPGRDICLRQSSQALAAPLTVPQALWTLRRFAVGSANFFVKVLDG